MDLKLKSEVAEEVGANAAIILEYIVNEILINIRRREHYYDGNYWMKRSYNNLVNDLMFLSRRQIIDAMKKLVDGSYVIKGDYNTHWTEKDNWYALTNKAKEVYNINFRGDENESDRHRRNENLF